MLNRYEATDWNIHHIINSEDSELLNQRTNNPLERFNRRLNEAFVVSGGGGKPTMVNFVETIRKICGEYVVEMAEIKRNRGRNVRARRAPVHIMQIPDDYSTFTA